MVKRTKAEAGIPQDQSHLIQRAKQELERMIDLAPQVMLLVDHHGTIKRANRAWLNFIGQSRFQDVLGKTLDDYIKTADATFFGDLLSMTAGYLNRECEATLPDGNHRVLRFTVVGSGRRADLLGVMIHDVTDEKRQARHLETQHKREAVTALMGALMHNINQHLTVIKMRAYLMDVALAQGKANVDELKGSLKDIMSLTTAIADLLSRAEKPQDFVTEEYINDIKIMDIGRSSQTEPS